MHLSIKLTSYINVNGTALGTELHNQINALEDQHPWCQNTSRYQTPEQSSQLTVGQK